MKNIKALFISLITIMVLFFNCSSSEEDSVNTPTTALPAISTINAVSGITDSSVFINGSVTNDGGAAISAKGICYATTLNPTIANNKTNDGIGIGNFVSNLSGLASNTTYYARVYATNSMGTAYGLEFSFTTMPTIMLATLTTNSVTSITSSTATSGGTIVNNGGSAISVSGICYATTPNPTIFNNKTTNGLSAGSYSSNLTSLASNTQYYVRAYATNSVGTSYGNEISFSTIAPPLAIGSSYQGGVIAYILQPGDQGYDSSRPHGFIAAPSDQSTSITWGGNTDLDVFGQAIGTGNTNTNAIVAAMGIGNYAAKLCYDLVLNGYSDWYLPSRNEMTKLWQNRNAIGGFIYQNPAGYWNSSEIDYQSAWVRLIGDSNGAEMQVSKSSNGRVRAIRSF